LHPAWRRKSRQVHQPSHDNTISPQTWKDMANNDDGFNKFLTLTRENS
jgi:hypothetical protein